MFENPRRGRQARNFTTNVSKILDLKSSSEQIFFRKLSLGAPDLWSKLLPPCACKPELVYRNRNVYKHIIRRIKGEETCAFDFSKRRFLL